MSDPKLTTWLGPPPPIPEECKPLDCPSFNFPKDFATKFNDNPSETVRQALSGHALSYIAQYLFYCDGIYPSAISAYAFSDEKLSHTFLVSYFSSITLDYIDIVQALRLLLSRISFPNLQTQLITIFHAFSEAYLMFNPFSGYNYNDVTRIAAASILFSIFQRNDSSLPKNDFFDLLSSTSLIASVKEKLYDSLKSKAIPIFFNFASSTGEPNYNKKGYLKKVGGMFKLTGKKQRFFNIDGFILKYYKDDTMGQQMGEVELINSVSSYIPGNKKDPEHLVIRRFDGGPIGTKVVKGEKKKGHHTEYEAYGNEDDLKAWVSACNFVSFWSILKDLNKEMKS